MKIAVISFKFHWSPIDIHDTTGSNNGLLPNGQQGILPQPLMALFTDAYYVGLCVALVS